MTKDKSYEAASINSVVYLGVRGDVQKLQADNPNMPVPMDLVTTSASGLDPHISPDAAEFQAPPRGPRARRHYFFFAFAGEGSVGSNR
jgi:K+-transporting ATPase c subunit